MTKHDVLLFAHVLLLVYWLGTDLGVFYSSRYVLRPDLSVETRATIARILFALDLSPRVCLVLMLPVGLSLAADFELSSIDGGWLIAVWVAAILWLALVVSIYRRAESPVALAMRRFDLGIRFALIVVLTLAVVSSVVADGPFATTWLALKVGAYTVALASGVAIRFVLQPFGPAIRRLVAAGSEPEVEVALRRSLRGTYPLVLTIWSMLIVAAWLGVAQP